MRLHRDVRVLVARRPVDAQPDPRPGPDEVLDPADARAQPHVAGGAVSDTGRGRGHEVHLGVVEVDAVRVPDVLAGPAEVLHEVDGTLAERLQAEMFLVDGLGDVSVKTHSVLSRELGRGSHQLRRHREGRARRHSDSRHRAGLRVVVARDHRLGVGEDRVLLLDHPVRRQAAFRLAQRHRASTGVESQAQLQHRLDQRLEDSRPAVRKHVVVVGRKGAAAQEQTRRGGVCSNPNRVGVDARPYRVKRPQPLEQRSVRRVTTRRPLVHVVVRVDEARHDHAVRGVDHLVGVRRETGADLGDHAVAGEHPAAVDLLAAGPQQPCFDDECQSVKSCGRTGTRLTSRPVAARIAATIAGPDEIVGGSPTPLRP